MVVQFYALFIQIHPLLHKITLHKTLGKCLVYHLTGFIHSFTSD